LCATTASTVPSGITAPILTNTWEKSMGFMLPYSCIWPRRTNSFPRLHKRRLKRHLLRNRAQRSTAIRGSVMLSPAIMGRITTPPRLTLPTVGRPNFYISNSKEIQDDRKKRDRAVQSDDFQAV